MPDDIPPPPDPDATPPLPLRQPLLFFTPAAAASFNRRHPSPSISRRSRLLFRERERERAADRPPFKRTLTANDASLADRSNSFQHVPLDEYRSKLRSISFFKELWLKTFINGLMQGQGLKGNKKMASKIYEKLESNKSRISQAVASSHYQRKK